MFDNYMFFLTLFFLFINADSFKLINHVSRKLNQNAFIGCDYYIEKRLCIFNIDNSYYCMNLQRERGYYDLMDSNLTQPEKIQKYLTPNATQTVYINHKYINVREENKYQAMVEYELIYMGKNWANVKNITVYEIRYER